MKDRQVSLKKVLLVSILSCLMISSTAAYLAAAVASDYYQVITGGQYPGAPSFTIYAQDGVYYAKNQYGGISWSSTDVATILALVPSNSIVEFAVGTFWSSPIDVSGKNITLIGQGTDSLGADFSTDTAFSVIKLKAGSNAPLITKSDTYTATPRSGAFSLKNIALDGNAGGQTETHPVVLIENCGGDVSIIGNSIRNGKGAGIEINNGRYITITQNKIEYNGGDAIDVDGLRVSDIYSNLLAVNIGNGLTLEAHVSAIEDVRVYDNQISANRGYGIEGFENGDVFRLSSITGNAINEMILDGIYIHNPTDTAMYITINNNIIDDNGYGHASGYNGIKLSNASAITIVGNTITRYIDSGCQDYGIYLVPGTTNGLLTITGNDLSDNRVAGLNTFSNLHTLLCEIEGNVGLKTEANGFTSGLNDGGAIPIDMAVKPTSAVVSVVAPGVTRQHHVEWDQVNTNATHLIVKIYNNFGDPIADGSGIVTYYAKW